MSRTFIKSISTLAISDSAWVAFREKHPDYTWSDVVQYFQLEV